MCANSETFNDKLLQRVGIQDDGFLCVKGLQEKENFYESIVIENGCLEFEKIEAEMVKQTRCS